jgi:hypothetical protein
MSQTADDLIIMSLPPDARTRYDEVLVRQKDTLIERIQLGRELMLEGPHADWETGFSVMEGAIGSIRLLAELWQQSQYDYKTRELVIRVYEAVKDTTHNFGDDRSKLWNLRADEVLESASRYIAELPDRWST